MGIPNVDFGKARTLLKYLAQSSRKIKERTQALRIIHNDICQIKKLSGKSARHKIAKLETNILTALRRGGFVEECEEQTPEFVEPEQESSAVEIKSELPIIESELSREEKLKLIEQKAAQNSHLQTAVQISLVGELTSALVRLESLKKEIKVSKKPEREQLKQISERIKVIKNKISALNGKKSVKKKKK